MLPDLPIIKTKLLVAQSDFIERTARELMPTFGDCRLVPVFEGDKHGIERATGDTDVRKFDVGSAEVLIAPQSDSLGEVFAKLGAMAEEFAKQMEGSAFRHLEELTTRHGQTGDAKGNMNADVLLEAFSKMELPLNKDGEVNLDGITIACAPDSIDRIKAAFAELHTSPEKHALMKELLKGKTEAALAREADRKLVE